MKIKPIIFLIFFLIISFSIGCKKNLEEKVFGTLPELTSVSELNAATVGIYKGVEQSIGTQQALFPMAEVGSRYSSYNGNEGGGNRDFYRYITTNRNPQFNQTWGDFYQMINRANEVIDAAPKLSKDTTVINPLIAEAKFLRGWSYFVLVQFFGDIPIHLKASSSIENVNDYSLPRRPVADVYAQIVEDLKYASVIFPGGKTRLPLIRPSNDLGRVTAATALGMLGKVYLTMAGKPLMDPNGYTNAVNTLKILVDQRGKYNTDLLPKGQYARIFAQTNEMNKEVLFAMRGFANATDNSLGCILVSQCSPVFSNVNAGVAPAANISPQYGLRSDIVNLFQTNPGATYPERLGDTRLRDGIGYLYSDQRPASLNATTGVRDSIVYNLITKTYVVYRAGQNVLIPPATTLPAPVYGGNISAGGITYSKWRAETQYFGNAVRGFNNDWILLRFADVLLCYAEALNETGQSTLALPFLNEVRARANARLTTTTVQDELRTVIREERTRELIGEFTTVFDMRRWGSVKAEMDALIPDQFGPGFSSPFPVYAPKFDLYPIPLAQISINTKLTQNPGWEN